MTRHDGGVATAYRLRIGETGPTQQSPVSCGAACLTVARMLTDPLFASWVREGTPRLPGTPTGRTAAERFGAYERLVMGRTNALSLSATGRQPPWPRALGTPPWGAKHELEALTARRGTPYAVILLRAEPVAGLRVGYDRLARVIGEGAPALLYVGNAILPRHVVLVLPASAGGAGGRELAVYDPASGLISALRADAFAERRLGLSGWDIPWATVQPLGLRPVRSTTYAADLGPAPA
ncbi:MAG TPA: hypothetical protein PLX71_10910 [Phycicoccus sp.]|nr:hypothetical protein [Phycicoccus sp.]